MSSRDHAEECGTVTPCKHMLTGIDYVCPPGERPYVCPFCEREREQAELARLTAENEALRKEVERMERASGCDTCQKLRRAAEADRDRLRGEADSLRARVAEQDQHIANLINTVRQHERNRESIKSIRAERDTATARVERLVGLVKEACVLGRVLATATHIRDRFAAIEKESSDA